MLKKDFENLYKKYINISDKKYKNNYNILMKQLKQFNIYNKDRNVIFFNKDAILNSKN